MRVKSLFINRTIYLLVLSIRWVLCLSILSLSVDLFRQGLFLPGLVSTLTGLFCNPHISFWIESFLVRHFGAKFVSTAQYLLYFSLGLIPLIELASRRISGSHFELFMTTFGGFTMVVYGLFSLFPETGVKIPVLGGFLEQLFNTDSNRKA